MILEDKLTPSTGIMDSFLGNVVLVSKLDGLVVDGDFSITAILPDNNDFNKFIGGRNLNGLRALEANLSWLIVIDDCNSGLGVLSDQFGIGVHVIKLHEEILIGLPVVIILDSNVESLAVLAIELNNTIEWNVVFVSLGITIDGGCTDRSNCFLLINDLYCKLSR